jgi:trehalose synthase
MLEVEIESTPLARLADILSPARAERLAANAARARAAFGDRVVWHVSATAQGGGVAEMLQTLLAYGRGAGIENRWLVLDGDPRFFSITKRLHNMLPGTPGDGGPLAASEQAHYQAVLAPTLDELLAVVSPRDIVMLHDPQTAGLVEGLRRNGNRVVWRCHVGRDEPNELTETGWAFLRGYLEHADGYVFSRRVYAPSWADDDRLVVIPPSIDPFSAKNAPLAPDAVRAILATVGLVAGGEPHGAVQFRRRDGTSGTVRAHRQAGGLIIDGAAPPRPDAPLVVQVSRWDRLKDMTGVMAGFVRMISESADEKTQLMLVGPDVAGVSDDPEGSGVLGECRAQWRTLPPEVRGRVHLASVPMGDADENAVIVNAIQRHAAVVVQKSLWRGSA